MKSSEGSVERSYSMLHNNKVVNLLVGPPSDDSRLGEMLSSFFGSDGAHIICGGTTSALAADYLGTKLTVSLDYVECTVPPAGTIQGVDLVTEGIITLGMVLDRADRALTNKDYSYRSPYYKDAVSIICRTIFDEAETVRFFIGMAINDAHQAKGSPIKFRRKMSIISELADRLCRMNKAVSALYY